MLIASIFHDLQRYLQKIGIQEKIGQSTKNTILQIKFLINTLFETFKIFFPSFESTSFLSYFLDQTLISQTPSFLSDQIDIKIKHNFGDEPNKIKP